MNRPSTRERLDVVFLPRHDRVCVTRMREFTTAELAFRILVIPLSMIATTCEFVTYAAGCRNAWLMLVAGLVSFVGLVTLVDVRPYLNARRMRRMIASPSVWLEYPSSYRRFERAIANSTSPSYPIADTWPALTACATDPAPLRASR